MHRKLERIQNPTPAVKRLKSCMSRPVKENGITIIHQNGKTGFLGINYCHNSWCCPNCAPYKLNRVKHKLESGFEMMKQQGYKALMITFTVPHTAYLTCRKVKDGENYITVKVKEKPTLADTFYLLKESFMKFSTENAYKQARGKDNRNFFIYEMTWGPEHGWHPHIHALFWLKPEQFDKFVTAEKHLTKVWYKKILSTLEEMTWLKRKTYERWKKFTSYCLAETASSGSISLYISKDGNGKAMEMTSSKYFWSGENEVADLLSKQGRQNHLTQWQILQKGIDDENPDNEFYFDLYLELVEVVRGIQQYRFKKGFLSEINNFEKEQKLKEEPTEEKKLIKKKEKPKIICWLSTQQWNYLKYREGCHYLILILSSFCQQENAFELISELCEVMKVGPPKESPPYKVRFIEEAA